MVKSFRFGSFCTVFPVLLGIQSMLFAQITINQNDLNISFGQQFTEYNLSDSTATGIPVAPGTTGGPQNWVFDQSGYPNGELFQVTLVDPSGTPFQSDFPSADYAFQFTDSLEIFTYFQLTNSALLSLGFGVADPQNPMALVNNPPEVAVPFPTAMGVTWTNNFVFVISPAPGIEIRDSTSSVSVVDAWGTIDIPIGSFNCLRVRSDVTNINTTIIPGIPPIVETSNYIEYFWITNAGIPYSLANISSLEGETDPNFTLAEDVAFLVNTTTGIDDEAGELPATFDLGQNYPNPFNPSTTIEYRLSQRADITLTVYNLNGEQVAVLASGVQPAGTHRVVFQARNLPSGIYFYRLRTNSGVDLTKQMILLR